MVGQSVNVNNVRRPILRMGSVATFAIFLQVAFWKEEVI